MDQIMRLALPSPAEIAAKHLTAAILEWSDELKGGAELYEIVLRGLRGFDTYLQGQNARLLEQNRELINLLPPRPIKLPLSGVHKVSGA